MREAADSYLWWAIRGQLAGLPMPFIQPERRLAGGGELRAFADHLPPLYDLGLRAVVSLLNTPRDLALYAQAGFAFLCEPVGDGDPPELAQALRILAFLDRHLAAGRPAGVHCSAGLGRTGTVLASYFIWHGADDVAAIARVRMGEPAAVESLAQMRFLRDFATAHRGAGGPLPGRDGDAHAG